MGSVDGLKKESIQREVPDEQGLEEVRLLHDDDSQVLELGYVP